jgi:hypothetical protein
MASPSFIRYAESSGCSRRKTALRRELGSLEALEKAAAKRRTQEPHRWENHRLREQLIQWMPDGASLLLSAGEDLFLWQIGSVKWRQLTATEAAERDPKLSPDGA